MEKLITKGFKVTDGNFQCRGYQYEIGKTFKLSGPIELCYNGFHFCEMPAACFNYYSFNSENRVFEIEASGDIKKEGDKSACSEITFIREIEWSEVLKMVNTGSDNTGCGNTGYSNTGNWNTGNSNTGNWNTGDRNTGDRNTGDSNTGNSNTGNWNTGDSNTGYSNTGNWNTGDRNTGYSNTGNSNTGNWNTGDRNTGYSNTGNRNTGAFCTGEAPFPIFNQPSGMTEEQFRQSKVYELLCQVDIKMWVPSSHMTEEEKVKYPSHTTSDGYLKDIHLKEAFQNRWHNWSESNKQAFLDLPNFNWEIFTEITGVTEK